MGDKIILQKQKEINRDLGRYIYISKNEEKPRSRNIHLARTIEANKWIVESYKKMNEYEIQKFNLTFIGRGRFNDAHIKRNYSSK